MNRSLILVTTALAFVLGCGGGSTGNPVLDAPDTQVPADTLAEGVDADAALAEEVGGDLPSDEQGQDGEAVEETLDDPGIDEGIKPVVLCKDNNDCPTGWCVESPEGKVCTTVCTGGGTCPGGYECVQVASSPDVVWACVHMAPRVCRPCKTVADCTAAFVNTKMACVEMNGFSFCVRSCLSSDQCETGFDCAGIGIGRDKWCVPGGGATCECTKKSVDEGAVGKCGVTNEFGTCEGQFSCSLDQPLACGATPASAEVCNDKDDDCDGEVDEEIAAAACDLTNVYGTCKGKTQCLSGKEVCQGSYPSPEVCNGIDDNCDGKADEGFPDTDEDGIADCVDKDGDGDGIPDNIDNCVSVPNADQADNDGDGKGDACDDDDDNDKVIDTLDNCPMTPNPDQKDTDLDGLGDKCDDDIDGDLVPNTVDNCILTPNPDQLDSNGNGIGDACDDDNDSDGVVNSKDNCPWVYNPDQANLDGDAMGDACDPDDDGDGIEDAKDNCPVNPNADQSDIDGDGFGDICDPDKDGDGIANDIDNCPGTYNPDQEDVNGNGIGDACEKDMDGDKVINEDDNCPSDFNPKQEDLDLDGIGDACDDDADGDGKLNSVDNCVLVFNPGQEDLDLDGVGDACDDDKDGDGDPNISDCKPSDPKIFHGAQEVCNGVDDNCNYEVDEENSVGCAIYYRDEDKDGFGSLVAKCLCAPGNLFTAEYAGDCDDKNAAVNPKAPEICGNGTDDNCNAQVDEAGANGCVTYYKDVDGDGFGFEADAQCLCKPVGVYNALKVGDCNDLDAEVFPGQVEKCNQKDDNCDTVIDDAGSQGCTPFFKDADQDGWGVNGDTSCLCKPTVPYNATKAGDCDDSDKGINPGATEACNGKDDNCNGVLDEEGAQGCSSFYLDADGDTYGSIQSKCLCKAAQPYSATNSKDCNDSDKDVHPGAVEACNGYDDDCNGTVDDTGAEGCSDYFLDNDLDGFGVATSKKCQCTPSGKYTANVAGDCNDADKMIYPGAVEFCNGKDDNCNGQTDEEGSQGCSMLYQDADKDGFGGAGGKCLCGASGDYTASKTGDCDDGNPAINPSAAEKCNTIDDNCDKVADPPDSDGCTTYYSDADGDGWGTTTKKCLCTPQAPFTATKSPDCNDADKDVNPAAVEACGDKIDNNCNGSVDEENATGCTKFYKDVDQDGHGSNTAAVRCLCGPDPITFYTVGQAGDCSDIDANIHPGVAEVCNNKDDNCDGTVDEGVTSPCGGCNTTCVIPTGVGTTTPFTDPNQDNSKDVVKNPDGSITLTSQKLEMPFIWVANSPENTVSKLNTDTGCEVARYAICTDPSRTAVDQNGNGIVTCRGDGKVAKVAIFETDCIDKNGNGKIDTSKDLNGNCKIEPNERVSGDECVLWIVQPDGSTVARAAGVDKGNNVWVGFWNSKNLLKLKNEDGSVLQKFTLTVRPYGIAIDKDEIIWVASRDPGGAFAKVSPLTGQLAQYQLPSGGVGYGIAVDPWNRPWLAGGESTKLYRFDPGALTFTTFSNEPGNTRGVAVKVVKDALGNVTAAKIYNVHHNWGTGAGDNQHRYVTVVHAVKTGGTIETPIDLGKDVAPVGCAVDPKGFLWTVNQIASTVSKVNTETKTVVGEYPVGPNPYTYSDMTGYAAKSLAPPSGYYRQIFTGWTNAKTQWDQLFVAADLPGSGKTYLLIRFRVADTLINLTTAPWVGPYGPFPPSTFPLLLGQMGNYLEVELTLKSDDSNYLPLLKTITVMASAK